MRRYHQLALAALALLALPAAAQDGPYPLGTYDWEWQPAEGQGGPIISRSPGWDPAVDPTKRAAKQAMVDDVEANLGTFPVGLQNGIQPSALGNTGCPVRNTINDPTDVAGLPTVELTGLGTFYLVTDCNFGASTVEVSGGMQVAFWSSAIVDGLFVDDSSTASTAIWVDSLIDGDNGSQYATRCYYSGSVCKYLYTEIIGAVDYVKAGPGVHMHKVHAHGYETTLSAPHHDCVQSAEPSDMFITECNLEGPFQDGNSCLRLLTLGGQDGGPAYVAKSLLGGGQTSSNTNLMGTKNGTTAKWTGGPAVFWANRYMALDGVGFSHTGGAVGGSACYLDEGPTGSGLAFQSDELWSDGNTVISGVSTTCGGPGPIAAVTAAHQTAINDAISDAETWASEVRTAAGVTASPTVAITSLTPSSPETTDDLALAYTASNFTATSCTTSWSGANSGSQADPTCCTAPLTDTLASSNWSANGGTDFVVTCEPGAVASSAVTREFADQPESLFVAHSPGDTTGTDPHSFQATGTISGTETGLAQIRLDETADGTWDHTLTDVGPSSGDIAFAFATPSQDAGPYAAGVHQYRIGTTRNGSGTNPNEVVDTFEVVVSDPTAIHQVVEVRLYDTTQPEGEQDTGIILSEGLVVDRRVVGPQPSPVAITNEYDNTGPIYTGPSSLEVDFTDPTNGAVGRNETNAPYAHMGDSGWHDSDSGIPIATYVFYPTSTTQVNGAYRYVATPYDGELSGGEPTGSPGATVDYSFAIARIVVGVVPAPPVAGSTFDLSYVVEGFTDTACLADCSGDGTFDVDVDEFNNTVECPGVGSGSYTFGLQCEGTVTHTLDTQVVTSGAAASRMPARVEAVLP